MFYFISFVAGAAVGVAAVLILALYLGSHADALDRSDE